MNYKMLNKIIANLEGCHDMFDYMLTPKESHLLLSYIKELQQENKKQKELIDRILNETKETRDILNNNRDDNILSKSCLLSYLEIVEDLLKEVLK